MQLNRKEKPSFERPKFFEFPKVIPISPRFFGYFSEIVPLLKIDLVYPSVITNKKGVSKILAKMLYEGTNKFSSAEIHETIAKYGAHLEIKSGIDRFTITLYTQKKYFKELITFLSELIFNSTIPELELEKIKNIEIQNIQVNNEKTSFIASNKFKEAILGQSHPYSESISESDVANISREDIKALYDNSLQQDLPEIFICGNYTKKECEFIQMLFQKNKSLRDTPIFPSPITTSTNKNNFPKEGALQSSIRIGNLSISRKHSDFIDMVIANEVLGGYFGSRLMKNIREEKGLTYGISSQCATFLQASYWVIGADVKKDLVPLAIDEINKEIETLYQNGVDNDEMEVVTNYMAGSFLSSINTPFDIVDKFKLVHYHELSYDYYRDFYERLFTITSENIQEMTSTYFKNNIEVIAG